MGATRSLPALPEPCIWLTLDPSARFCSPRAVCSLLSQDTDPDAEPTPNKLKALVQANEFLTWLDSATQESGPSDDD